MYQNYQSVIVDLFIVTSFLVHVCLALTAINKMFPSLNTLLNKGVTDHIFKRAKKAIYIFLFVALSISCLVTWRLHELLTFFDVIGWGKYILVGAFAIYCFSFLGVFIFCKLLLMTARRSGL
ncbi:hypothetical protein EA770_07110 [Acinetobacter baumannii]|nr:hypothetical protein EA770_07110 [Acinetobacter baumannii]